MLRVHISLSRWFVCHAIAWDITVTVGIRTQAKAVLHSIESLFRSLLNFLAAFYVVLLNCRGLMSTWLWVDIGTHCFADVDLSSHPAALMIARHCNDLVVSCSYLLRVSSVDFSAHFTVELWVVETLVCSHSFLLGINDCWSTVSLIIPLSSFFDTFSRVSILACLILEFFKG